MRHLAGFVAGLLLGAGLQPASVAMSAPSPQTNGKGRIAEGAPVTNETPYAVARRQLARQGLSPVRVFDRPEHATCRQFNAPCYPELLWCRPTVAGRICDGLFRRRSDGRYMVASAFSGRPGHRPKALQFSNLTMLEASWLGRLDGFTIATAAGAGKQYFCVHHQEAITPLCTKDSGSPCWVKPPANDHPARRWCD
jgi:hypothetical protein